jgi:predicted TIM-barrel fold metal-dependent hydrolase
MDANGVAASVLVPALRHIAVDNREGNDEVLAAAASSRGRLIPMCSVNPWYGSRAVTEFRRAATAGAVALKLHPALQGFCLTDRLVHAVVKEADTLGLPIYVHTGTPPYAQPLQLAELARTFAQVTFVMGHAGSTDLAADAVAAAELAGNIVVETSWTLPARLVRMVESLGSSRVMFGSDAPFSDLSLEIFNHRAAELSPEDMNAVMGLTALRLFGPTR